MNEDSCDMESKTYGAIRDRREARKEAFSRRNAHLKYGDRGDSNMMV